MDIYGLSMGSNLFFTVTPWLPPFTGSQSQQLVVLTSELRWILGTVSQDHCATRIASLAEEHAHASKFTL